MNIRRPPLPGGPEKTERSERTDRSERTERTGQAGRSEQTARSEQTLRSERSGFSQAVTRSQPLQRVDRPRTDGFEQGKKKGFSLLADAAKMTRAAAAAAKGLWADQTGTLEVWPDRSLPDPPGSNVITVATYNLRLGDRGAVPVAEELAKLGLDALFVQDCTEEPARAMGRILKMHVAYSNTTQKVVLSRHPIMLGEETPFERKWAERMDAAKSQKESESALGRSILRIAVSVGDRPVDLVDVHLSVKEPVANEGEAAQLVAYLEERQRAGHAVVLAGDFRSNASVAQRIPGWHAATEQSAQSPETAKLIAQAQAELASGKLDKSSPRYRQLVAVLKIADTGAKGRFDDLRVSKDVAIRSFVPEEQAARSKHPPLFAELRWK